MSRLRNVAAVTLAAALAAPGASALETPSRPGKGSPETPPPSPGRTTVVTVASAGGFRFTDAGIGAAGALGVTFLAAGTVLVVRSRRAPGSHTQKGAVR
jgi:hypothetical protein